MGQKLTVSARETSPIDDAGFFSVVLSYENGSCLPKQNTCCPSVFGPRSSPRCPVPGAVCVPLRDSSLPPAARRSRCCPVHYSGHSHYQLLQLCVEVADCRLRLRGTFHRSSTLRRRHSTHPHLSAGGTMLSVVLFSGTLRTNRLVLGNSRVFKS